MMALALVASLLLADEVADLVKKLRAADLSGRYQAEYDLGKALKPQQIPLILKEIDAGPVEFRPHFIRAIRWVGGKEAVAALKGVFASKYDMKARVEAAYALKILQEDDAIKSLVIEIQRAGLSKEDKLALLQYLYSFYYDGKEVPPVLRKIIETEKEADVRKRALEALASHKDPESAAFLRKLAEDDKDPLRIDALCAVIKLGDPDAVERGLQHLEKGKIALQDLYNLLFALRTAGGRDVVARLRAMLDKTDDVNVRCQLINTLSLLKDTKAIAILIKLVEDKNASIAEAAVNALVELAGRGQVETIRKLLKHASVDRRLKAAEALVALDEPDGVPVLREVLNEKTVYHRQRAATALAGFRRKEVVEALLFAMSDEEAPVRTTASNGLVNVLSALYPYRKFELLKVGYDAQAGTSQARADAIAKIREWWEKNK